MPFMSTGAINLGTGPNPQWGLGGGYRGGNTPSAPSTPSVSQPAPEPSWETGIDPTPRIDRGPGSVGGSHNTAGNAANDSVGINLGRGPNPGWGRGPNPSWGRGWRWGQRARPAAPPGPPPRGGWGQQSTRPLRPGPFLPATPGVRAPMGAAPASGTPGMPPNFREPALTSRGMSWDSRVPTRIQNNSFAEGGAVPHFAGGGTFTTWSNPPGTPGYVPPPFGASIGYAGPPGAMGSGAASTANRSSSTSTNTTRGGSRSGSYIPDYIEEPFLNELAQYSAMQADALFGRYADAFQPLEDELIADARSYASPERIRSDMGRAGATVAQQMEGGREAALQRMTDYGINVNSGRYAGLNRAEAVQSAAAQAGAMNQARMQDEQIARGLRSDAINLGTRNLQDAMGLTNIGMSLRYPPLGNNSESWNASDSSSFSVGAPPGSPGGGGGGSRGGGGNNSGGGSRPDPARPRDPTRPDSPYDPGPTGGPQVNSYNWGNNGGDGGIGDQVNDYNNWYDSPYGPGSADFGYLDDPGWDYTGAPYADFGGNEGGWGDYFGGDMGESFAGGGAIDMDPRGEDPRATTGGFVSRDLSPSGGRATDDIPARLNADEFVIPRDVTMWKGQEFFQKLIAQSRQNRQGAPAKPTMKPAAPAINMGA